MSANVAPLADGPGDRVEDGGEDEAGEVRQPAPRPRHDLTGCVADDTTDNGGAFLQVVPSVTHPRSDAAVRWVRIRSHRSGLQHAPRLVRRVDAGRVGEVDQLGTYLPDDGPTA